MYTKVSLGLTSSIIEVREYGAGFYGAPGKRRKPRKNFSPEVVKKYNAKSRERWIQNLLILNFNDGWNITLRYRSDNQPESYEQAKENLRLFRDSVRRQLAKYEIPFKYIVVTEKGSKKGHFHHHIIVESLSDEGIDIRELIKDRWGKYGTTYNSKLYDEGNYQKLAEYLAKSETKEAQKNKKEQEGKQEPTYRVSRNLKKPTVLKKENYYGNMREPEAPKGWFVDKESVIQGINPYTGKKYQRYYIKSTLEKVIEKTLEKEEAQENKEEEDRKLVDINLYMRTRVIEGRGDCIYLLEFIKKDGSPYIKPHHTSAAGTKDRIAIFSILSALKYINVPARIKIFNNNPLVKSAICNDWPEKWQKQKWKNEKGNSVKDADLWENYITAKKTHDFVIAPKSEFSAHEWSLQQLDRIAEKYYKQKGIKG